MKEVLHTWLDKALVQSQQLREGEKLKRIYRLANFMETGSAKVHIWHFQLRLTNKQPNDNVKKGIC